MPDSLLIVEDDLPLRETLLRNLRAAGFTVTAVASGRELLDRAAENTPSALVIDIGLPDADGRDVCQALRAQGVRSPVLFLSARDALTDRLSGFGAGGDDYVTKPFDVDEVVARLHALIKRANEQPAEAVVDGLSLDPSQHSVSVGERSETLTPTEFRVLAALAARPGRTVNRRQLIEAAWPHGAIVHDNTLDVYIARLRRKLANLGAQPEITTQHGVGYRLSG
ncbi:MAG TPA: response regulator transcription factor [Solirubrobacteraceae bacterium]